MGNNSIASGEGINDFVSVEDPKMVVRDKLLKSEFSENLKTNDRLLKGMVVHLSNAGELKESFLALDWNVTKELHRSIDDEVLKSLKDGERYETFTSEEMKNNEFDSIVKDLKRMEQIPVTVLITESHTSLRGNVRRAFSPILWKPNVSEELGNFTVSLMIGPWLIEWNDNSLCIPKKGIGIGALFTQEIYTGHANVKDLESVTKKLSEVIVKWNTHYTKEKKCLEFITDIFQHLKLEYIYNMTKPCYSEYFGKINSNQNLKLEFSMDEEFKKKFKVKEEDPKCKCVHFNTHAELDKFMDALFNIEPEFECKYRVEYIFLKNLDRQFWLKHITYSDREEYMPNRGKGDYEDDDYDEDDEDSWEMLCPFKDPNEVAIRPRFRFMK